MRTSLLVLSLLLFLTGCGDDTPNRETDPFAGSDAGKTAEVVGTSRPKLSLEGLDGKTHSLDEWRDKVMLVNFWATWCPPCQREMPAFRELQSEYGEDGLVVVGIAIDRRDKVAAFAESHELNFPILIGGAEAARVSGEFGNAYGGLPYSVVVDREGIIRFSWMGELDKARAEAAIEPLL